MKVLSKKKLLKQYGFPRTYLSGPGLGSSWPGGIGGGDLGGWFLLGLGVDRESVSKGLVVGLCLGG